MGIPFRGYLDSRDSVLEERVKEEGPRLNQRHGFREGERQSQGHLDEQQRNLRSLQAGMEMYRRSIAEEEADRYAGAVMVGHLDRFDMNPRLNNIQYSPMRSYSVEYMANRLMDIWRWEMHTSSEQILERFHQAIEEGNLTAVFQTAAIMRSPLGMVGPNGDTALHLACLHGHYEIAQFLLDMGHAANVVDEDGATPLHDAAAGGYVSVLGLLLDKAPDCVHRSDNDGDSPLHNAVRGDHFDCVSMLLDAGADPYCINSMSLRPIDLTTHGSRTYTRLFEAARDAPLRHAVIDPDS
eukprot:jgi/Picre1/27245/NNA_000214.t1